MNPTESLSQADRDLLEKLASGSCVTNLQHGSGKYRELVTGILLQYADSEMAGSAGYSIMLPLAPSLAERAALAGMTYEKLSLAQKTYELVSQTGINIDKYIASHCWEARLGRGVSLGYRRISGDKRVNALMYPLQGWHDLAVFTYLMASMACLQLEDFSKSSFEPWAKLAAAHLPVEQMHKNFGLGCIERVSSDQSERLHLQLSMNYWYEKVLACFGPPDSLRNAQYKEFGLKSSRNEELSNRWEEEVRDALSVFDINQFTL